MHVPRSRVALLPIPLVASFLFACGRGANDGTIVASGHVEATEVRLAAEIGGRVDTFPIEEGSRVKAGDEVARIDTTDLELRLRQGKAERDLAEAEWRLRLEGPRKEEIAGARASLLGADAELAAAERDLIRMQELLDRGSGTEKGRDDARVRRDLAASRVAALRETVSRLETGSRRQEIAASRARLAAAEARVAQLEKQIADGSVASPIAGTITRKLVEEGEIVQAGTPLAVLVDLDRPWLTAWVPGPDVPRIRLGGRAEVVTDDGTRREGAIAFIASEAEFTPKNVQTRDERTKLVYKVKISLPNADGLFKPGMPAEARIAPEEAP